MPTTKTHPQVSVYMKAGLRRRIRTAVKKDATGGTPPTTAEWVRRAIVEKLERDK